MISLFFKIYNKNKTIIININDRIEFNHNSSYNFTYLNPIVCLKKKMFDVQLSKKKIWICIILWRDKFIKAFRISINYHINVIIGATIWADGKEKVNIWCVLCMHFFTVQKIIIYSLTINKKYFHLKLKFFVEYKLSCWTSIYLSIRYVYEFNDFYLFNLIYYWWNLF